MFNIPVLIALYSYIFNPHTTLNIDNLKEALPLYIHMKTLVESRQRTTLG